ncbi:MAG: hypothetical protein J6D08_11720 [Lachnospiraceae bacterium]|nr:hypothetical protein [Lachnospiraceae bacterium]
MRRPVQMKYAAQAAHRSRTSRGEGHSSARLYQTRADEICRPSGARVARGAEEKDVPLLDCKSCEEDLKCTEI